MTPVPLTSINLIADSGGQIKLTHSTGYIRAWPNALQIRDNCLYVVSELRSPYATDLSPAQLEALTALGVVNASRTKCAISWSGKQVLSTSWYTGINDTQVVGIVCGFLGLFRDDNNPGRDRYRQRIWDNESHTYHETDKVIDGYAARPFIVIEVCSGLVIGSFERKNKAVKEIERIFRLPFTDDIWITIRELIHEHETGILPTHLKESVK